MKKLLIAAWLALGALVGMVAAETLARWDATVTWADKLGGAGWGLLAAAVPVVLMARLHRARKTDRPVSVVGASIDQTLDRMDGKLDMVGREAVPRSPDHSSRRRTSRGMGRPREYADFGFESKRGATNQTFASAAVECTTFTCF